MFSGNSLILEFYKDFLGIYHGSSIIEDLTMNEIEKKKNSLSKCSGVTLQGSHYYKHFKDNETEA